MFVLDHGRTDGCFAIIIFFKFKLPPSLYLLGTTANLFPFVGFWAVAFIPELTP